MGRKPIRKEDIEIPEPCFEALDPATAGRARRYCHSCEQHVYDTSKLTRSQVDRLLERDDVCLITRWKNDQLVVRRDPTSVPGGLVGILAATLLAIPAFDLDLHEDLFASQAALFASQAAPIDAPATTAPELLEPVEVRLEQAQSPPLPAELAKQEKRVAYRLKTEFGIDIEGSDRSTRIEPVRSKTLRDALEDLDALQRKRDDRTGVTTGPIRSKTLRQVLEDIEVIGGSSVRMGRRVRTPPNSEHGIEIINGD